MMSTAFDSTEKDSSFPAAATAMMLSNEAAGSENIDFSPLPPSLLRRRALSCHETENNDDGDSGHLQYHPPVRKEGGKIMKSKMKEDEEQVTGIVGNFSTSPMSATVAASALHRKGDLEASSPRRLHHPHRQHVRAVSSGTGNACISNSSNFGFIHDCDGSGNCGGNSFDGGDSISQLTFSTPIRSTTPVSATTAASVSAGKYCKVMAKTDCNRERANTCPRNRSTVARNPSRWHDDDDTDNTGAGGSSSDEESGQRKRRRRRKTNSQNAFSNHSPLYSANSPQSLMNRASHLTAHAATTSTISSPSPSSVVFATQRTPHTVVRLSSSPSVALPNPPTPPSPTTSRGTDGTTPIAAAATTTTTAASNTSDCLLRINPTIMKLLMFLSLYLLLSYTWKSDLQYRYQSMDINNGLSEYWHGGLGSKIGMAEKIGKRNGLFNDDGMANANGVRGEGEEIAKLLLLGNDDGNGATEAVEIKDDVADSSEDVAGSEDGERNNDGFLPPLLGQQQGGDVGEHKKLRPSLSYARSILTRRNAHHKATAAAARRRKANLPQKKWTFSKILWAILSFILMIPIIEASTGEIRRRIVALHILRPNIPVYARYYQRWRPSLFRGGGGETAMTSATVTGRVRNVHNL